MRKILITVTTLAILATLAWAGSMPEADPGSLWTHIAKASPYQNWGNFTDHMGKLPGKAPHGPLHVVYANEAAQMSGPGGYAYGSIIVKENWGEDACLKAITVMYKIEGFDPGNGDWYWAKYGPDGTADKAGKVAGCIGCHGAVKAKDYVFVHTP